MHPDIRGVFLEGCIITWMFRHHKDSVRIEYNESNKKWLLEAPVRTEECEFEEIIESCKGYKYYFEFAKFQFESNFFHLPDRFLVKRLQLRKYRSVVSTLTKCIDKKQSKHKEEIQHLKNKLSNAELKIAELRRVYD